MLVRVGLVGRASSGGGSRRRLGFVNGVNWRAVIGWIAWIVGMLLFLFVAFALIDYVFGMYVVVN